MSSSSRRAPCLQALNDSDQSTKFQSHVSLGQIVTVVALVAYGTGNLLPPSMLGAAGDVYLAASIGVLSAAAVSATLKGLAMRVPLSLVLLSGTGFVTAYTSYAMQKIFSVVFVVVLAMAVSQLRRNEFLVKVLAWLTLLVCVAGTIYVLVTVGNSGMVRLAGEGQNPISTARLAALGVLMSAALIQTRVARRPAIIGALLGVASLCVTALWATGSRGPALALAIGLLFLALAPGRSRLNRILLISSTMIAGSLFLLSTDPQIGSERILSLDDSGRMELAADSFRVFLADPLGVGWGGLGEQLPLYPVEAESGLYPHNLFLEFASEAGVLGLAGFIVAISAAFLTFRSLPPRDAIVYLPIFVTFVFALVNAMVSSDIVGNRLLWTSLVVILASTARTAKGIAHA